MKRGVQMYLGLVGPRPRVVRPMSGYQNRLAAARENAAHEKRKGQGVDRSVADLLRGIRLGRMR